MLVVAIELWPNILNEERASKLVKDHTQQQQKFALNLFQSITQNSPEQPHLLAKPTYESWLDGFLLDPRSSVGLLLCLDCMFNNNLELNSKSTWPLFFPMIISCTLFFRTTTNSPNLENLTPWLTVLVASILLAWFSSRLIEYNVEWMDSHVDIQMNLTDKAKLSFLFFTNKLLICLEFNFLSSSDAANLYTDMTLKELFTPKLPRSRPQQLKQWSTLVWILMQHFF